MKQFVAIFSLFLFFSSASQSYDFVVAKDGSGDFITIQEAINAIPDFRKTRTTIFIKPGIYKEKLTLSASKTNVTFIGEDVEKSIITFYDFASKKNRFGEEMGKHIKPEGWHNWGKSDAEKTAFFAEYKNTGPGAKGNRVNWSHELSDVEVLNYTPEKILGEWSVDPQLFRTKNEK